MRGFFACLGACTCEHRGLSSDGLASSYIYWLARCKAPMYSSGVYFFVNYLQNSGHGKNGSGFGCDACGATMRGSWPLWLFVWWPLINYWPDANTLFRGQNSLITYCIVRILRHDLQTSGHGKNGEEDGMSGATMRASWPLFLSLFGRRFLIGEMLMVPNPSKQTAP